MRTIPKNISETMPHRQHQAIDVFKLIAAILVVAIHTQPFYGSGLDYYFTSFCRIAVPFFFTISSYFFWKKTCPNIKHYTKRIATIYISWLIIYLPTVVQDFFIEPDSPFMSRLAVFLRCLVFSNTFGVASWYLMASIIGMLIIYVLSIFLSDKLLLLFSATIFAVCLTFDSYFYLVDNLEWSTLHHWIATTFCPASSFTVSLIYIAIGKILAKRDQIILDYIYIYIYSQRLALLKFTL